MQILKIKKEQLKMLSGRYLDRINLLEAQKNVLNKQASLLSSKIEESGKKDVDLHKLNNEIATKSRMTLYTKNISNKNTRIIWLLKNDFLYSLYSLSFHNCEKNIINCDLKSYIYSIEFYIMGQNHFISKYLME